VAIDQGAKLPALVAQVGAGAALMSPDVSAESLCDSADRAMGGAADLRATSLRLSAAAAAHGDAIRDMVGARI